MPDLISQRVKDAFSIEHGANLSTLFERFHPGTLFVAYFGSGFTAEPIGFQLICDLLPRVDVKLNPHIMMAAGTEKTHHWPELLAGKANLYDAVWVGESGSLVDRHWLVRNAGRDRLFQF